MLPPSLLTALQRTIYGLFTVRGSLYATSSRAGPHTAPPCFSPLPMFPEHIADIQKISAKNNGRHLTRRSKHPWGGVRHTGGVPGREDGGGRGCSATLQGLPSWHWDSSTGNRPFSWKDAEQSRLGPGFESGRASLSLPLATGQLSQATESWDSSISEGSSLCPIYTQHDPNLGREPPSLPWYISGLLSLHDVSQCKASCGHANRAHH